MSFKRIGGVAVLAALAVGMSGCSTVGSTVGKLNPFHKREKASKTTATEGQRISIIAFQPKVEAATSLKGQDFYLPPAAPQADWPLPGGTPEQSIENVQAGGDLRVAWRRGFGKDTDRKHQVVAPPVEAEGRVYVMDGDSTVAAIDANSGQVVWRTQLPSRSKRDKDAFGGGVAYSGGKLYVATGQRYMAQLDAATGAMGWKTDTDSPMHAAPTVVNGRVFAVSTDDVLQAWDANTGQEIWNYQALVEPARLLRASSPAVTGDTVVATFASGEVIALRAENGNDLWNQALSLTNRINALSEIRDIAGRPVIYKGDVYAASHSGVFAAIDMRSGAPRWTLPVTSITTPWPAGDVVYIVSQAGEVMCVSRESGQVYWIQDLNANVPLPRAKRGFGIGPLRIGGSSGKLRPLWTGPVLASDKLVLASNKGQMVALNPKTGAVLQSANLGDPVLISPIAVNGTIYFVTDKADLVAVR
ncbi:MAG: PQQ-binding-like beta-propeller repeat protein [Parcubacteria group bacterium]